VDEQVKELIEQVITSAGFEFVHCEVTDESKQRVLRVLVDHPEGMTLNHCSHLSHQIGLQLDQADLIPQTYLLEVSSPGVERGLYRLKDYQRFAGHQIKLRTSQPIDGSRNFRCTLLGVREPEASLEASSGPAEPVVMISIKGNRKIDRKDLEIPFSWIEKAHLEVNLPDLFRVAKEKSQQRKPS
jgi:ribosome maturation factor RimP